MNLTNAKSFTDWAAQLAVDLVELGYNGPINYSKYKDAYLSGNDTVDMAADIFDQMKAIVN